MNNKNLGGGNWHEYDFRIAGNSEYHKALLRQMIGLPAKLPGEKSEISKTPRPGQTNSSKTSHRGYMPGYFQQGKG